MKGKLVTIVKAQDSHIQCLVKFYPKVAGMREHWETGVLEVNTLMLSSPEDREVFLRLVSKEIRDMEEFEVDGNGLSLLRRKVGSHPSYMEEHTSALGSNLYPMTKMARLRDPTNRHEMVVVSDRSQAVTVSPGDSAMDILVQR